MQQTFPDLSILFAAKAQRRLALAALSWEAKVAIIEQMRQLMPKAAWKSRSHSLIRESVLANGADNLHAKRPISDTSKHE